MVDEDHVDSSPTLTFRTIYEYATESPLEELSFILEGARMNRAGGRRGDGPERTGTTLQEA